MNILLTNDDGYFAPGIILAKEKLSKYGHVVIVAPEEVMSAKSVGIILGRSVSVKKISDDVFAMEGTPADCVAFGLSSLNIKFDLVVSGCNDGFNVSYDTMYSGTIGACLQAMTYRVAAIALSGPGDFKLFDEHFDEVMEYINKNNLLSKQYVLSVNFPYGDTIKGIKITNIYYRKATTFYVKDEEKYYAYRELKDHECKAKNTDVYAIHNGYISITKIARTLQHK